MGFSDFHGNSGTVRCLREMVARQRLPQAIILAGPAGSGKYTLALMLARTINCLEPTTTEGLPDFCGKCSNFRTAAGRENVVCDSTLQNSFGVLLVPSLWPI